MPSHSSKLSRRTLFAGAGAAGVLATAVSALPSLQSVAPVAEAPASAKPEKGGGYVLSERVKQYYATARV
jgi:hypothetical protein